MHTPSFDYEQVKELLLQALEAEKTAIEVGTAALGCVINPELKQEWQRGLERAEQQCDGLTEVLEGLGQDASLPTPGREVLQHLSESLVEAIAMAVRGPDPRAAELVAAECMVSIASRRQLHWELIGRVAAKCEGEARRLLQHACETAAAEPDEMLARATDWTRELWLDSLGLPASLPPEATGRAGTRESPIGQARRTLM